ncbi:hypothetical protein LAZ67_20001453 [Cordylochernes scorpioides]|uniref:Transposase n=1 Tax=Cordylochernes scorpioides TaxID=51811 RepID=A0ABY6LLQ4_9ARAC|nr:hypothetical protein LAZ67_20001453 [Cordylochernes scorpioides]
MPLHQPRVTVWCGFTSSFIIGPYYFEEINGRILKPFLKEYSHIAGQTITIIEIAFMQDGGPPHISRSAEQLLKDTIGEDCVISRQFKYQWLPRSPDLTPCNFWLWKYIKPRDYRCRPPTLAMLNASIRRLLFQQICYLMLSNRSPIVCRRSERKVIIKNVPQNQFCQIRTKDNLYTMVTGYSPQQYRSGFYFIISNRSNSPKDLQEVLKQLVKWLGLVSDPHVDSAVHDRHH